MAGVTFGEVGFVTNLPTCHVADHGGGTELRPVKYPNTAPDTMIILWLWVIWDYNGITLYYSDIEVMGLLWGNYWSLWNTISNGIIFRDRPSLKCFQISQKPSTDDFFENNGELKPQMGGPQNAKCFISLGFFWPFFAVTWRPSGICPRCISLFFGMELLRLAAIAGKLLLSQFVDGSHTVKYSVL